MTVTAAEPITTIKPNAANRDGSVVVTDADSDAAGSAAKPQQQQQRPVDPPSDKFVAAPKRDRKGVLIGAHIPLQRPNTTDGARTPSSTPTTGGPSATAAKPAGGPTQAAIDAALDRGTGPGAARAGADAAADAEFLKRWKDAPVAPGAEALVQQRLAFAEVMVPANETEGVTRLTEIRRDEVRNLLKNKPDMARVLKDDFNNRFNRDGRGNFDEFMDFVSSQMARQDWVENRVGADRPGNVRVAMLGAEAIIARAREIGRRAAEDPKHFSPMSGAWLAFVLDKVRSDPGGDLAKTLAGATNCTIMRFGVGQLVQQGRIPANADPKQLERRIRTIVAEAGKRLEAAGGPRPLDLPPVIVGTGRGDPSNPPLIDFRDFRIMANEAMRRGDPVTFVNPSNDALYTPTRRQIQTFLASPVAQENYYSSSRVSEAAPSPVVGTVGAAPGDVEHAHSAERRAQDLEAAVFGSQERQRAHVADLDLRRRKHQGDLREAQNRVQSALNLGDTRGLSESAAANRALGRHR